MCWHLLHTISHTHIVSHRLLCLEWQLSFLTCRWGCWKPHYAVNCWKGVFLFCHMEWKTTRLVSKWFTFLYVSAFNVCLCVFVYVRMFIQSMCVLQLLNAGHCIPQCTLWHYCGQYWELWDIYSSHHSTPVSCLKVLQTRMTSCFSSLL